MVKKASGEEGSEKYLNMPRRSICMRCGLTNPHRVRWRWCIRCGSDHIIVFPAMGPQPAKPSGEGGEDE